LEEFMINLIIQKKN